MKLTHLVLDASIAIKWLTLSAQEENWEEAQTLKGRVLSRHLSIEVPSFLWIEISNFLARENLPAKGLQTLYYLLKSETLFDPIRVERALNLVQKEIQAGYRKATVYDMLYIELALHRGCPLITADKFQAAMAKRAGVEILTLSDFR